MNPQVVLETSPNQETILREWRDYGTDVARALEIRPRGTSRKRPPNRHRAVRQLVTSTAALRKRSEAADLLLESVRLIHGAERDTRETTRILHTFPEAVDASGDAEPRVTVLARRYLTRAANEFTEETLSAFLDGYQRIAFLNMGEIWTLQQALQLEIIDRLTTTGESAWPALLTSLRNLGYISWNDLFETHSRVGHILAEDPTGTYPRMDFESRDRYRFHVGELAKYSARTEIEVAQEAIAMARAAQKVADSSRATQRRGHVGYYLVDRGTGQLASAIGYHPPRHVRLKHWVLNHPTAFYLTAIELLTLALVFVMLLGLDSLTPIFAGLVLLVLPATQAAVAFVNSLASFLVKPRVLPKLELIHGVPDDCTTLVAVPALLLNESQVKDLVLDLEIRYLANRDPNIYFALLTDSPDSDRPVDQADELADSCARLVHALNRRYHTNGQPPPFFLLHRYRSYNESEGRWMGWERKRGKLLDLNQLLRGAFDAFPVKVGDLSVLPRVRYVITLDSDTQLPRDAAARLIGTIAHPLNQAVVDPQTQMVVEGYGILQPRVGISIQSAARSRFARLYSGQTGFDIYTRAISDVYQDLFGEGIYTGKGIYEVDALRETLERRFPENALLSHDLIEGAYARAALVSDIEVVDDYPSHFSGYSRRKHRWVRGDWQILRWILSRVPDYHGRLIPNPISLISQWKIVDNLRRSLFEPSLLLLLLGGWLCLPRPASYWTVAAVIVLLIPSYASFLFSPLRAPWGRRYALAGWARETGRAFIEGNATALFQLIFLLHQSLLSIDAIVRSLGRVFVTRRKLLEWETAAEAEIAGGRKATVDVYLEWTPVIALLMGAAVRYFRPAAFPVAAPILTLWLLSRFVSAWLNRRPGTSHCRLRDADTQLLRCSAERIYRFFRDWSTPATNWLIPDRVDEDGGTEMKLSPTNLAMLLNARVGGVHLGLVPLSEFVYETEQTLERVVALPKYRGHLYNWYDILTLKPIEPLFISSVDSGNLAAGLWVLKQAALAFAYEPAVKRGSTKELVSRLMNIAATCDKLVAEMDFSFLYNPRRKAVSIGANTRTGRREAACYDLLASEARIGIFLAVAKGDIPQQAWVNLGRGQTQIRGERSLLSWSGTMFEYFMPVLWMRHYPGTITESALRPVVRVQREHARRKGVPWGISESACVGDSPGNPGYAAFGIPELAIKRVPGKLVISAYASFLALPADAQAVIQNLREWERFEWTGRYGFYEAVEYTIHGAEPVRSWMAHHQGMSLLAIVNLLHDNAMQEYFHSEPQVLATDLLLHERASLTLSGEGDSVPLPESESQWDNSLAPVAEATTP